MNMQTCKGQFFYLGLEWKRIVEQLSMPGRPSKDPCQNKACAIQDCLAAHNYKESACQEVLKRMQDCCNLW